MAVDISIVKRVAHLARIRVSDDEAGKLLSELNAILGFVEQLNEVDVDGVEPMTSVLPQKLKSREDRITEGGRSAEILANAPLAEDGYFLVPKVVE